MPIIDPKIEEPTRSMLGHAIRGELQELSTLILATGNERYRQIIGFCLSVAAYIATDVSGRWPTDADTRQIARAVATQETELTLDEASVYAYLADAVLGFKPLTESLGGDAAATTLPILITASMLFTFRPDGLKWWDYLDQVWSAYEKAETVDVSVLPALQVRVKMLKAAGERSAP